MRILAAIDVFGLIGGSERYAAAVVHALALRGHAVDVLCGEQHGDLAPPPGGAVTALPAFSAQRLDAAAKQVLTGAVAGAAPNVILLLTCRSAATFELLLELAPLVRFVQDHTLFCPGLNKLHADGTACVQPLGRVCLERYFLGSGCSGYQPAAFPHRLVDPLKLLWRKQRELAACRRARRIVVASRYMRSELVQAGLLPDTVVTIPYFSAPVAPGDVPAATLRFVEAGAPLLLAPARLTLPDKGIDYLITALGHLEHDFRCVIAGDGPARAWLEQKVRDEGLGERVHFTGWLGAPALAALYGRARAVAFPSIWKEPFGLVGLEAMAAARPVVAFAVGGVPEWLADGETGFLAPPRDTQAFAAALERLLTDEKLAARLGAAGCTRNAEEFGEEAHLAALERALAS